MGLDQSFVKRFTHLVGYALFKNTKSFFQYEEREKKWARALDTKEALVFLIEFVTGERKKMVHVELMMKNN
jgi:hypothetical protein